MVYAQQGVAHGTGYAIRLDHVFIHVPPPRRVIVIVQAQPLVQLLTLAVHLRLTSSSRLTHYTTCTPLIKPVILKRTNTSRQISNYITPHHVGLTERQKQPPLPRRRTRSICQGPRRGTITHVLLCRCSLTSENNETEAKRIEALMRPWSHIPNHTLTSSFSLPTGRRSSSNRQLSLATFSRSR